MTYVIGALAGILLGGLSGYLKNIFIWKKYVQRNAGNVSPNETSAVYGRLSISNVVNIAVLVICFLLRKAVPFSWAAFIIGTAVSLSIMNILLSSRLKEQ